MAATPKRHLEPIIKNFKVVVWTCSSCVWRKMPEDAHEVTANTLALYSQHRCEDHPVTPAEKEPPFSNSPSC